MTAATFASIEGTLDPVRTTELLLAEARRLGARIIYPCEVLSVRPGPDGIAEVATSQGAMTADRYVIAAGADTTALARQAGLEVRLKTARGVLAHSKPMRSILDRVVVFPGGGSIKQNPDGRLVTGAHFAGSGAMEATSAVGDRLLAEAALHLPELRHARLDYMTAGNAVMGLDGLPVVGAVRGKRNLFVAAMNSGVTLAPIIGQLAAIELLDGVSTDMLEPYRV